MGEKKAQFQNSNVQDVVFLHPVFFLTLRKSKGSRSPGFAVRKRFVLRFDCTKKTAALDSLQYSLNPTEAYSAPDSLLFFSFWAHLVAKAALGKVLKLL